MPSCGLALTDKFFIQQILQFIGSDSSLERFNTVCDCWGVCKVHFARRCHPLCWFYRWPNTDLCWTGTDLSQTWKTIGQIRHLGYRSGSIQRHNRDHPKQIWVWNRSELAWTINENQSLPLSPTQIGFSFVILRCVLQKQGFKDLCSCKKDWLGP